MSRLLSPVSEPDQNGRIQHITPESAGWEYVGFEVYKLKAGRSLKADSLNNEVCLVILTGKASVKTLKESWSHIGERTSLFEQKAPYAVYVPPSDAYEVTAETDLELAVCSAPAMGQYPARLITPAHTRFETRGIGTNQRHVCNILFGNMAAEKLLVCEVITPDGNWSSYPPHKHDRDLAPTETKLEETYYHRIDPDQGFVFQRVYTDNRSIDETMAIENHGVVMVPEGYHPVGAPHGYTSYYLNVMAGPAREWIFHNDPDHAWIIEADKLKASR
ncbi:5-deoxy-glucuronate isomerase [Reinekea forsetii]|uniref:5-deoxy-glucuronate isomerase / myo-inositol catabolism protein IolB n=1 Tax=Reinekea forsetii TaxID=1336806 RepID=A0A2K8KUV7_9GAMM|nr:5-deoxy-glucuronate isomerase [Reinekea forsetii]ATX78382.1 5-deoxy-glucuronate isomerase / myo-inositol catabolism protein IolB [Reinekea forsetii]